MNERIFDIYDDTSYSLLKVISNEYDMPDYVKTASMPGESSKTLYALPSHKKFPMDTPADLWLSNAYFEKTGHQLSDDQQKIIKNNLEKTANLLKVDTTLYPIFKEASIDYNGYAVSDPDNPLYPLHTEDLVKKANQFFPEGLDGENGFYRTKVARAIASRLPEEEWSREIKPYLPIPRQEAISDLNKRASFCPEFSDIVSDLKAASLNVTDESNAADFISAVEMLDKEANLEKYYGGQLLNPIEYSRLIWNNVEKNASIKIEDKLINFDAVLEKKASIEPILGTELNDPYEFENAYLNLQSYNKKQYILNQIYG